MRTVGGTVALLALVLSAPRVEAQAREAPATWPEGSPAGHEATPPRAGKAWSQPAVAQAAQAIVAADSDERQPYALTISGGVSLGAYEAGLNWAVIQILRRWETDEPQRTRPALVAVTGASAGSINAIVSAAEWCREGRGTPAAEARDNLFRRVWLDVGADDLLPGQRAGYAPDDGLLSRRALNAAIQDVRQNLLEAAYRPGCDVAIGLTVTRQHPAQIQVAGLTSKNQRFVVPLRLRVDRDRRVRFAVDPIAPGARRELLGNVLYPAAPGGALVVDQVIELALASSAFPVAFGPRRLAICETRRDDDRPPARKETAPCDYLPEEPGATWVAREADFLDGGVFDNVPLGVAMALVEPHLVGWERPIRYIYLDPDNVRGPGGRLAGSAATRPATGGHRLADHVEFLGGAVTTARGYELHNVLRYNDWNARELPATLRAAAAALEGIRPARGKAVDDTVAALQAALRGLPTATASGPCYALTTTEPPHAVTELAQAIECLLHARPPLRADAHPRYAPVLAAWLRVVADALDRGRKERGATPTLRRWREAALETLAHVPEVVTHLGPSERTTTRLARLAGASAERFLAGGEAGARATAELAEELAASAPPGRRPSAQPAALAWARRTERCARLVVELARGLKDAAASASPASTAPLEVAERLAAIHLATSDLDEAIACVAELQGVAPPPGLAAGARDAWARLRAAAAAFSGHAGVLRATLQEALAPWDRHVVAFRAAREARAEGGALAASVHLERRLLLSRRFAPLAGDYLVNFSAFLDRPLREHDYAAGVYDALHGVAELLCADQAGIRGELDLSLPESQICLRLRIEGHARALALDPVTATIVDRLAAVERDLHAGRSIALPRRRTNVHPAVRVMDALLDGRRCEAAEANPCLAVGDFPAFVASLRRHGYRPASRLMTDLMAAPDELLTSLAVRRGLDRLLDVEQRANPGAGTTWGLVAARATVEGVRGMAQRGILPLTPHVLAGPARVDLGLATGLSAGWGALVFAGRVSPWLDGVPERWTVSGLAGAAVRFQGLAGYLASSLRVSAVRELTAPQRTYLEVGLGTVFDVVGVNYGVQLVNEDRDMYLTVGFNDVFRLAKILSFAL